MKVLAAFEIEEQGQFSRDTHIEALNSRSALGKDITLPICILHFQLKIPHEMMNTYVIADTIVSKNHSHKPPQISRHSPLSPHSILSSQPCPTSPAVPVPSMVKK